MRFRRRTEIRAAIRHLAPERGRSAEGAGAAAAAALPTGKAAPEGCAVAVVSGRNITSSALAAARLANGPTDGITATTRAPPRLLG